MVQDDVETRNCSKPTTMDTIINYHSLPVFSNLFCSRATVGFEK